MNAGPGSGVFVVVVGPSAGMDALVPFPASSTSRACLQFCIRLCSLLLLLSGREDLQAEMLPGCKSASSNLPIDWLL